MHIFYWKHTKLSKIVMYLWNTEFYIKVGFGHEGEFVAEAVGWYVINQGSATE